MLVSFSASFFVSMDVTFHEHESYYPWSANDTRIALSPPEVGQEGENTSGGTLISPVLVPTLGVSPLDSHICRQGEQQDCDNNNNSGHGDMQDAIGDSSSPS